MPVGATIDRLGDVMSHDGCAAAQRVRGTVRSNPIPFALVGLGVAWMGVLSNRSGKHDGPVNDDDEEGFIDRALERAATLQERARDIASDAGDRADMMADRARRAADRAETRATENARKMRRRVGKAGALAFATGAALGAMLPNRRPENRGLGPRAAALRHEAREAAADGVDRARQVAHPAFDTVAYYVFGAVQHLREESTQPGCRFCGRRHGQGGT